MSTLVSLSFLNFTAMSNEKHFDLFADQNLRQELHSKATGILKCRQLADDAVQETYIKMIRYPKELPTKGDWIALSKCVLKRTAIDLLRKKKVIQKTMEAYLNNGLSKASINPHKRLEDKEQVEQMERLIAEHSDERGQKMIWLRAKGYKYDKIAEELGTSIGSATGQVARIRKKLKLAMEKQAFMQNKYQAIEQLLHKYWEANTSVEEEKTLEDFFTSSHVPTHLAKFVPIFQHSKAIRTKASRQKVGKLLGICSFFAAILFVTYLFTTSLFFSNSPVHSESVATVQEKMDKHFDTGEVAYIHASLDASDELPHLLVQYQ